MIHRGSGKARSAFYLIYTSLPEVGIYARISSRITRFSDKDGDDLATGNNLALVAFHSCRCELSPAQPVPFTAHLSVRTDYILSLAFIARPTAI